MRVLRHQPTERRRSASRRGNPNGRLSLLIHRRATAQVAPPAVEMLPEPDFATQRMRAAGGPTDQAYYTCACGCVFQAPVSATVSCPHCGGDQAW